MSKTYRGERCLSATSGRSFQASHVYFDDLAPEGTTMNVAQNMLWAVAFSLLGAIIGIALVLAASALLPRLIDRLTPAIDEEKEIARGNVAVAQYFGRVVAASIIGVSIVVAAAVVAGVLAALQ
jgi:uncharacterized membrane protein YjfL (UPF0719 family)